MTLVIGWYDNSGVLVERYWHGKIEVHWTCPKMTLSATNSTFYVCVCVFIPSFMNACVYALVCIMYLCVCICTLCRHHCMPGPGVPIGPQIRRGGGGYEQIEWSLLTASHRICSTYSLVRSSCIYFKGTQSDLQQVRCFSCIWMRIK